MRVRSRLVAAVFAVVTMSAAGCLGPSGGSGGGGGMNGAPAAADTIQQEDLALRLDALSAPRPERAASGRNPFRFGGARPGQRPDRRPVAPFAAPGPRAQPGRFAPPPALRFIGLVDAPESAGAIAVLTDGDRVFQGRAGDTVAGRYRIARITAAAVEVEELVAGGRRTLRLDGVR